ncbi:MAG TPA: DUF484 family protein [Stellaceae bacterium]|jgi:uncharacterized protein YigA (DUF484 family)|nr:DUF484 family protein [Stellaceae bacterium]
MVDSPRDQTRSGRDAAVRAADARELADREITAREVMGYLRRHPEFLDEHPEALRLLRPPSREIGEGVVDFQQFLYERQRRELNRVNLEYRNLIAVSRGNLASQSRVHKAALTILAAPSFGQLLQIVTTDLAVLLDVDAVTIAVENVAGITPRLNVQGIHLLEAGTIEERLGPDKPVLYEADVVGDPTLFGAAAGLVRSQALLRLRFGRETPMGLLCIGTRKPGRFHPGLGTELLGFLGRIVGLAIGLWLNPVR